MRDKKPTVLLIPDGMGFRDEENGNAAYLSMPNNLKRLWEKYPHALISASGEAVGLPKGQMGNSEVGHTNLGSGRIVLQDLMRINHDMETGDYENNPAFVSAIDNCIKHNSAMHIMGLCSDGGVHSQIKHLYKLIELCKKRGLEKLFIHCFLDGRDTSPMSGLDFISELETVLENNVGKIATVSGRFYAMDRDNRYERVKKAYDAIVFGEGEMAESAKAAISKSYESQITDEFVKPTVICKDGKLNDFDSVIFFNYRPDRAREISSAIIKLNTESLLEGFIQKSFKKLCFVGMSPYSAEIDKHILTAFSHEEVKEVLAKVLSDNGLCQLHIAETEKYAHVTFFFNGGKEEPFPNEDRVLIPSPKVATYDLKPEMSAYEVTRECVKRIEMNKYDFIVINLANPDMVGHTGILSAAVKAMQAVDECVGMLFSATEKAGGRMLICSDHGNCEEMIDESGNPCTTHTTREVSLILADDDYIGKPLENGRLCDIAPTILKLMNISIPEEFTGKALI